VSETRVASAAYCHAAKTPGREADPTEKLKTRPNGRKNVELESGLSISLCSRKSREELRSLTKRTVFGLQRTSYHVDRMSGDQQD